MFKALDKWFPGYLASLLRRESGGGMRDLVVCVADHYEPCRGGVDIETAMRRIERWREGLPRLCEGHRDADGRMPQHTFFYPAEEYHERCLDAIGALCADGYGEVEIHLHHRHDTRAGLRNKLDAFTATLSRRHGMLGRDRTGRVRYGFIHGNWALCNSRPDGDWCGVDDELGVLVETGCYADFTFPSAPSPTQSRTVNSLYYASDTPGRPRGHDRGRRVRAGMGDAGGGLMLIQGPLALNWASRKWGLLPRIENGEVTGANPLTRARIALGVACGIGVQGAGNWVFLKLHAHGCLETDTEACLGASMGEALSCLERDYNDGRRWRLHYVTAREMYNIIRAAEAGRRGNPGEVRDHEILPPHGRACS
jgi:hypothetical protein